MNFPHQALTIALTVIFSGTAFNLAAAQSPKLATRDALGCFEKDLRRQAGRLALSGDEVAYKKLAMAAINAGKCRVIDKGTRLYLDDYGGSSGIACFRPAGQTDCLWTSNDITE